MAYNPDTKIGYLEGRLTPWRRNNSTDRWTIATPNSRWYVHLLVPGSSTEKVQTYSVHSPDPLSAIKKVQEEFKFNNRMFLPIENILEVGRWQRGS